MACPGPSGLSVRIRLRVYYCRDSIRLHCSTSVVSGPGRGVGCRKNGIVDTSFPPWLLIAIPTTVSLVSLLFAGIGLHQKADERSLTVWHMSVKDQIDILQREIDSNRREIDRLRNDYEQCQAQVRFLQSENLQYLHKIIALQTGHEE